MKAIQLGGFLSRLFQSRVGVWSFLYCLIKPSTTFNYKASSVALNYLDCPHYVKQTSHLVVAHLPTLPFLTLQSTC